MHVPQLHGQQLLGMTRTADGGKSMTRLRAYVPKAPMPYESD